MLFFYFFNYTNLIIFITFQEENNNNVVLTGNKNHAAVSFLQEIQRTNAGKKFNITNANPLLAGTYSDTRLCTYFYIIR